MQKIFSREQMQRCDAHTIVNEPVASILLMERAACALFEVIINDYNNVLEQQDYPYPSAIRKRIKKQYEEKMTLPLSLSADIVECKSKCCTPV